MFSEEICEANPDCVIALDARGTVLYINPSGVALWEFETQHAAIGMRFADLIALGKPRVTVLVFMSALPAMADSMSRRSGRFSIQ